MNRRDFLKSAGLTTAALAIPGLLRAAAPSAKKINILLLMDDQHRGDYLGAAGASWLQTPCLDRLAAQGALFRKGYTSVPSCLPARAGLLTGMSPWSHGVLGYAAVAERYEHEKPRMFTEAGYRTHAVGKNHFNPIRNTHGYQSVELEEGFHSMEPGAGKCDYQLWFEKTAPDKKFNPTDLHYNDSRGGRVWPYDDSLHATHWTAQRAVEFLKTYRGDKPWMMKVSFQRPHSPFDPPKRWADAYADAKLPAAAAGPWADKKYGQIKGTMEKRSTASMGNFSPEEVRKARQAYCGAISFVDEQVGRVIAALEARGELENTLILFTSDHGEQLGDSHLWRKCRPYEPSVRVPMIVRWPEAMKLDARRGQVRDELVELRDVLPTLLDAAGLAIPAAMDGASMLNILRGKGGWRTHLDMEHSQIYDSKNAWNSLTDGHHKYIYFTLTGEQQLFDLDKDPAELNNLAGDAGSAALLGQWRKRMIAHLQPRGEHWVKDGDLTIQKTSLVMRPGFHPKS
ncbi:MAG: arylsulfatase [Planctomycetaceae bacterium]|nr:arylsulfatase [Planctomycetaceae bacterium]